MELVLGIILIISLGLNVFLVRYCWSLNEQNEELHREFRRKMRGRTK